MHQVENRIPGLEDKVEELHHSSKDMKNTKIHKRSIQEFCDTMKRSNLCTHSIEDIKEPLGNAIDKIFNQVTEEIFLQIKERHSHTSIRSVHRT